MMFDKIAYQQNCTGTCQSSVLINSSPPKNENYRANQKTNAIKVLSPQNFKYLSSNFEHRKSDCESFNLTPFFLKVSIIQR